MNLHHLVFKLQNRSNMNILTLLFDLIKLDNNFFLYENELYVNDFFSEMFWQY